ncbi:hypothetical protein ACGF0J_11990 [Nonomuraea sp. NPDC047897]|uniref:hypothetical protein n=1 Tax=Nonomuraea sp. NPDC047897 TaxID=3364346 RepID=UPI003719D87D
MPGRFTRGFDAQKPRNPEKEQFTPYRSYSDDPDLCPHNSLPSIVEGERRRGACYHDSPACEVLKATLDLAELCGHPTIPTPIPVSSTQRFSPCPCCVAEAVPVFGWEVRTKNGWRPGDLLERWQHPAGSWAGVIYVLGDTQPFAGVYSLDEVRRPAKPNDTAR